MYILVVLVDFVNMSITVKVHENRTPYKINNCEFCLHVFEFIEKKQFIKNI